MVVLVECGTRAFVAAEVGGWSVGEKTLANRFYPRLRRDELLTADRNFYSFDAWGLAAGWGVALLCSLTAATPNLTPPRRIWFGSWSTTSRTVRATHW